MPGLARTPGPKVPNNVFWWDLGILKIKWTSPAGTLPSITNENLEFWGKTFEWLIQRYRAWFLAMFWWLFILFGNVSDNVLDQWTFGSWLYFQAVAFSKLVSSPKCGINQVVKTWINSEYQEMVWKCTGNFLGWWLFVVWIWWISYSPKFLPTHPEFANLPNAILVGGWEIISESQLHSVVLLRAM